MAVQPANGNPFALPTAQLCLRIRVMPFTIIGTDDELTTRQKGTSIFNVHLTLSGTPGNAWIEAFLEARKYPRHSIWRKAYVRGKCIVVECPLDEIERHLTDLKADVETANVETDKFFAAKRSADEAEAQRKQDERTKVSDALSKLKFE